MINNGGRQREGAEPMYADLLMRQRAIDELRRPVQPRIRLMYALGMEVSITTLRAELATWIERARSGEDVVITDRGTPVAHLTPVVTSSLIESLTEQGVLSKPTGPRPIARGAHRVQASGPVSGYVSEHRR